LNGSRLWLKRRSEQMSGNLKRMDLRLPAGTDDLRALAIGTIVYLTGRIFTAREGAYKHAIDDGAGMPASPEELGRANFHCSPAATVNPDGSYSIGIPSNPIEDPYDVPPHGIPSERPAPYTVGAVSATASFRFVKWLDHWFKLSGCNIIIGKGGMTSEIYRTVFVPNNAIYLTTVGYGTGALLGRGIRGVAGVYWREELGLAQAVWVLDVADFGPFLVESDLEGNSLFERENAKIAPGLDRVYAGTRPATMRRYGETDDKREEIIRGTIPPGSG
jgi:L(+)-tartrate dehydratase beta subunit